MDASARGQPEWRPTSDIKRGLAFVFWKGGYTEDDIRRPWRDARI